MSINCALSNSNGFHSPNTSAHLKAEVMQPCNMLDVKSGATKYAVGVSVFGALLRTMMGE
eukprot:3075328-Pleurochrysis_carterae.AAC.2